MLRHMEHYFAQGFLSLSLSLSRMEKNEEGNNSLVSFEIFALEFFFLT